MLIRHMFTSLAILLFIPSQIFWLWQVRALGQKFIRNPSRGAGSAGWG